MVVLYTWLVARLWAGIQHEGKYANLLLLFSEGLVIAFMLVRRRARDVSLKPDEWLLALAATCLPLLATPGGKQLVPAGVAGMVLVAGILVQLHAKVTLGRSFGLIPANRGLKLQGPYRFVRHPMYAGYLICHLGYLAVNPTWWNLGVYSLCLGFQLLRLLAEERLLARDESYRSYRTAVPYRLIPAVF
ncbi:MAG TPA: methyltransferase [Fimbriiglobus sp.]|nr:methyltransferase [Fimbriiglobus sp.]